MAGARFVRADLHVHLVPDGKEAPSQPIEDYVQAAVDRGIEVLGITDHNTAQFVRSALGSAKGRPILGGWCFSWRVAPSRG